MNWVSRHREGHTFVFHEGGTGGYSSFAGFDRAAKCAVVLLKRHGADRHRRPWPAGLASAGPL